MAFFRKSDDPWDIDPSKRRKKREPVENPLDSVRAWNEKRKADAAAKQAELEALPKEKCPWCGREMERGYLAGGKGISWYPGFCTGRAALLGPSREARGRQLQVDREGDFVPHHTAWICHDCGKMVLDTSDMRHPDDYSFWGTSAKEDEPSEEDGGGEEAP